MLIRHFGFFVANRGEPRSIRRVRDATAREIRAGGGFHFFKHDGLDAKAVSFGEIGQVFLGRGAGLYAHGLALELLGILDL